MDKKYISPTFCSLGWNHQFLGPNGNVKPCCRFISGAIPKTNNIKDKSITEVFTGEWQQDLRQHMINGERHPGCMKCWQEEDSGKRLSIRQNYNRNIQPLEDLHHDLDINNPKITWLELSFNNRCNIRCRMCGPYFSTNWYQDWELVKEYIDWQPADIPKYIKEHPEPRTIDTAKLDPILPNIRHLKMTGGEPFIMPEYKEILYKLVELDQAKHVYLNYSTNLTIMPKEELIELWSHFKHIEIATSLDGVGPVIEYIRHPTKFTKVIEVVKQLMLLSHTLPIRVGSRPTITVYNISDVPNITNWWAEMMDKYYKEPFGEGTWLNHTHAGLPDFLSLPILNEQCKNIVMERLWDKGPTEKQKQNWNQLCNYMNSTDLSNLLPQFTDFTNKLDNARGENFINTVPEFTSLMEST
jgi:radical SAM protein with 4Fe4S-binding SPASM domain